MFGKLSSMPQTRVEPSRRAKYDAALRKRRRQSPDLALADWMREAFDRQAAFDEEELDGSSQSSSAGSESANQAKRR